MVIDERHHYFSERSSGVVVVEVVSGGAGKTSGAGVGELGTACRRGNTPLSKDYFRRFSALIVCIVATVRLPSFIFDLGTCFSAGNSNLVFLATQIHVLPFSP